MQKKFIKNPYSLFVVLFCSSFIVYFRFHDPVSNVLSWDVFGYYLYLPARFIYHDLALKDLTWINHIINQYHTSSTFYQACLGPTNHMVFRYSMGLAYLFSPFFFIAHWLAPVLGYPADGFSLPYQFSQVIGALIWCVAGIVMLRKLLLKYFSDGVVAFTLLTILMGTNYLGTAAISTLMPHIYLFTLYTLIFWFTSRWYENKRPVNLVILGFLIGLSILIRPTEGISILIPFLWGVHDRSTLLERVKKIFQSETLVITFLLPLILVILPQLYYWNFSAGKFLYDSYVNPGEGMDLLPPHTIKFLFSFRKGWFIYTPVMLFAVYGFYLLFREKRTIFWALTVYFIINLVIVSSWSNWWFGACFSQRGMVQSYSLMAIPLALVIDHWGKLRSGIKYFWFIILSLLILLNLFQHWQYSFGYVISPERETAAYYFKTFWKTSVSPEDQKLLLVDRDMTRDEFMKNLNKYDQRVLGTIDFENRPGKNIIVGSEDTLVHSGKIAFRLDSNCIYTPPVEVRYKDITKKEYAWIKASVWVYPTYDPKNNPTNFVILYTHHRKAYNYHALEIDNLSPSLTPGKWSKIEMYWMTPEVRSGRDVLTIYLWHVGKKPVFVDDLVVEAFEPK